ncbi:MAG: ABC transporter permease [Salinirussus sp.]
MTRASRILAATRAATLAFLRRRTAVFFTFLFPLLIVVIFGVLIETGGTGLFAEPPGWYVAGYLAVVVLFTPLSRVGSEVARHRDGNRFEKIATTPLTRAEWLFAQTVVGVAVIGAASIIILGVLVGVTNAGITLRPTALLLIPYIALAVTVFCGIGAMLGSLADSQDGVIAASNALAIPLLFLSETFVPRSMLPGWLPTELSPLTYFARGVRAVTYDGPGVTLATFNGPNPWVNLAVLAGLAVLALVIGAVSLPVTD